MPDEPIILSDDLGPAYQAHREQLAQESAAERMLARVKARSAGEAPEPGGAPVTPAGAPPKKPSLAQRAGAVAADVGRGLIEAPAQAVGGVSDAVHAVFSGLDAVGDWLNEHVADLTLPGTGVGVIDNPLEAIAGPGQAVAPAKTVTGGMVRTTAQFLTGFIPAMRALRAVGVTGVGGAVAGGAAADFAVFEGQQQRLSNLWQELGLPANVLTDYLAAKEGDSEIEGRFKNALEGAGLGVLTEGVLRGASALRAALRARPVIEAAAEAIPKIGERDLLMLGSTKADAPLFSIGPPAPFKAKPGGPAAMRATETGVPEDVAARGLTQAPHEGEFFINFARIDAAADVKAVMQQMADAFRGDIEKARRGIRTNVETRLSAEQVDAFAVLAARRQGQPLNAEEALAARQLWASSAERLTAVAREAAQNPSEANLFAFRKMMAVHYAIQNEVIAARTETARALQSWRIPAGGDAERFRAIDAMLQQSGGADATREMARRVAALSDAGMAQELDRVVRGGVFARSRDAFIEAWVMGLLSGPKTHLVNVMSNTSVVALSMLERRAAEGISRALGTEGGVEAGEAAMQLFGLVEGFKDALRYAWKALKTGESGMGLGKLETPREGAISAEALGMASGSWAGRAVDGIGQLVRVPGRLLVAEDEFFKTIGYRMELKAQALRQAAADVNAGRIPPDRLKARIAELVENPPENLRLAAADQALYQTFTQAPGKFAASVGRLVGDYPGLRLVLPFVRTPANIARFVFERTPLAPLMSGFRADLAAGGARRDLALARMGLGSAVLLTAADLAMSGRISGGGPVEPSQKAALMRTGWQPYSIKVGDRWYSYRRGDPLGMTLGLAADMVEMLQNTDWDSPEAKEAEAVAAALAAAVANSALSKTYLSGLSELFDALSDPARYSEGYFKRQAGSLVPTGAAEIARAIDPYMREVASMVDGLRARTPGLSQDLPPRRDLWGRPLSYESGLGTGYDILSPVYSRREDPQPIDAEILRLEANVRNAPRVTSIDGVRVDLGRYPEAYSRYVELAGNALKHPAWGLGAMDLLNAVVSGKHPLSQIYALKSDGPDGGKAAWIADTIGQYRELAKRRLLEEFPQIAAEWEERRRRRQELKLPVLQ